MTTYQIGPTLSDDTIRRRFLQSLERQVPVSTRVMSQNTTFRVTASHPSLSYAFTAPKNSVVHIAVCPETDPNSGPLSYPDFNNALPKGPTPSKSLVTANQTIYYVDVNDNALNRACPVDKGWKVEEFADLAPPDDNLTGNYRPSAHIPGESAPLGTGTSVSPARPKDGRRSYCGDFYKKGKFTIGTSDNLRCPTQGQLMDTQDPNGVGSFALETKGGKTRLLAYEHLQDGGTRLMDGARLNTYTTSGPDHVRFASLKTPVWPGPQPVCPDPMWYYPEDAMFSKRIPRAEVQDFLNDRKKSEDEFEEERRVKNEEIAAGMEIWAERCKEEWAQQARHQADERSPRT